jgi:hypothetical protein
MVLPGGVLALAMFWLYYLPKKYIFIASFSE